LRTIGNEGDSDKIGQLFDCIQSQKTEGSTTTSICTCSWSGQLHSRFSEQIGQLGGLQQKPTIGANPIPEGLECAMYRSIQPYMGERNPLDPPTYPNNILDFNDTQTVMNYSDCGGTLVARPTLVHNTAIRKLKLDYPWTIEPNPDSVSEYDSETSPTPTRHFSSLTDGCIADRGRELLIKFLDDWMKSKQYSFQDVLRAKPGFIIPEIMSWFTGQHKTPKSPINKQSCNKSILQLIFDREPMRDIPSAPTNRVISNCNEQT
ncbi:MAG: hypothetical protein EZS28_026510, partial [Streblomastix strix]